MRLLYIIYDPHCGLCSRVREWMLQQPSYLPLQFVASGSRRAQHQFPQVAEGDLAVISDTGEAWLGDNAFVICLWALKRYRRWALRLARPAMLPLARRAFHALSDHRLKISELMNFTSDAELADRLRSEQGPTCQI